MDPQQKPFKTSEDLANNMAEGPGRYHYAHQIKLDDSMIQRFTDSTA
jgi:hypothetical protein